MPQLSLKFAEKLKSKEKIILNGTEFLASPEKYLIEPVSRSVFLSDMHFGKVSHFRKNGIPLTNEAKFKDLRRLNELILKENPEHIYFLGDLFHSEFNSEWNYFAEIMQHFHDKSFYLIKGNHDMLHPIHYQNARLQVMTEAKWDNGIIICHEPPEDSKRAAICGHIHPGIKISGKAKQHVVLPCFFLRNNTLILPAFSSFSGLHLMNSNKKTDKAWIIIKDEVISI